MEELTWSQKFGNWYADIFPHLTVFWVIAVALLIAYTTYKEWKNGREKGG